MLYTPQRTIPSLIWRSSAGAHSLSWIQNIAQTKCIFKPTVWSLPATTERCNHPRTKVSERAYSPALYYLHPYLEQIDVSLKRLQRLGFAFW